MKAQGIIYDKSKIFALGVIALCNELREKGEYVMSKQILKSGTSIGANYWLDLLHDSKYLDNERYTQMSNQVEELFKMLNSSAITVKQRLSH